MKKLIAENCRILLEKNILPFWIHRMIDETNGGFYGRIDGNNVLHADADKGIILNTRILWTFSAAYRQLKNPDYLNAAARAFEYLTSHFLDQEEGGVYWMLNAKGEPVDTKKQVYAQAFAIYALSEFYKVVKDPKVLDLARSLYEVTEKYSFDKEQNGYLEAFNKQWQLLADLRLSEKDANEAKTMNTHLHVLEAYTNLLRVWPNDDLRERLDNLITLFLNRFISEGGHFHLFFDENWKLKSQTYSYGHDIEGGWLLVEAAEVSGNEELLKQCKKAAIVLTDAALEGMDEDGGLMNEGDIRGVEDTDKHWWPQAEALVGLVNVYQLTGNSAYLQKADDTWRFINTRLVDTEGEWHWMVHRDGSINRVEDKAGPWKCPYHNGRAMLELMERLGKEQERI